MTITDLRQLDINRYNELFFGTNCCILIVEHLASRGHYMLKVSIADVCSDSRSRRQTSTDTLDWYLFYMIVPTGKMCRTRNRNALWEILCGRALWWWLWMWRIEKWARWLQTYWKRVRELTYIARNESLLLYWFEMLKICIWVWVN